LLIELLLKVMGRGFWTKVGTGWRSVSWQRFVNIAAT